MRDAAHLTSADSRPIAVSVDGSTVALALLVGGSINGFAARIFEAWSTGAMQPLFAISPIELFALYVATVALRVPVRRPAMPVRPGLAEWIALAGMMIPSSTVAWSATAGYAAYRITRCPSSDRTAVALFLALSISSLWSTALMKLLTIPITAVEAWSVAFLLHFVRPDIVQTLNVVGQTDGHSLVILTACSAFDALPRVLLGIFAVATYLGPIDSLRLIRTAAAAAIVSVFANEIRLLSMAWSSASYEIVHGPVGANLFDLWQIVVVLVAGTRAGSARQ